MSAYQDKEKLGDIEANRNKATAVTKAAREVARHFLLDHQCEALAELLRVAGRLRDELPTKLADDVVWLFRVALGDCSKGYAWVSNAELDLAGVLLEEFDHDDDRLCAT